MTARDSHQLNLAAYFHRIAYTDSPQLSVETLHAIIARHVAAIPFENIDVLLHARIDTAPAAVERKLVELGRGGYCFETNQLLFLALRAIGFEVKALSARVRWLLSREITPPRTHMFIQVKIADESWLTDVGVGGCALSAALRWEDGLVQSTPHDERRLVREGENWFHQVRFTDEWLDVCEFTGEPMPVIDQQIANWWTSTHPDSKFRKNLIVAKACLDGRRLSLLNRDFTVRRRGWPTEKRHLTSQTKLLRVLAQEFDLPLPPETQFEAVAF